MDMAFITIQQVSMLFILIFAGFVGVKSGALASDYRKGFSDLLIYLIIPAMIINSYIMDFDTTILKNMLITFGLSFVIISIGFLVAFFATWKNKDKNTPIVRFAMIFSNAAYMGFPLIQALFGQEGLIYASVFVTVYNILLWTVAYAMMTGSTQMKEIIHTLLTNPVPYAVIIGLFIFILQIPMPKMLQQPINMVGTMTTPISMFITGMIIASSGILKMIRNRKIWYTLFIRMVVAPIACLLTFYLFGIRGIVADVLLVLIACPCAAITTVFAVRYHYDEDFAAGAVVITTLCSIVTLPVFVLLLGMLLG